MYVLLFLLLLRVISLQKVGDHQALYVGFYRCFPLSLLPSVCLVSVKFSNVSFLITCPRNVICLFLLLSLIVLLILIFSKSSSLLTYSVNGILSILLSNYRIPYYTAFKLILKKLWCEISKFFKFHLPRCMDILLF